MTAIGKFERIASQEEKRIVEAGLLSGVLGLFSRGNSPVTSDTVDQIISYLTTNSRYSPNVLNTQNYAMAAYLTQLKKTDPGLAITYLKRIKAHDTDNSGSITGFNTPDAIKNIGNLPAYDDRAKGKGLFGMIAKHFSIADRLIDPKITERILSTPVKGIGVYLGVRQVPDPQNPGKFIQEKIYDYNTTLSLKDVLDAGAVSGGGSFSKYQFRDQSAQIEFKNNIENSFQKLSSQYSKDNNVLKVLSNLRRAIIAIPLAVGVGIGINEYMGTSPPAPIPGITSPATSDPNNPYSDQSYFTKPNYNPDPSSTLRPLQGYGNGYGSIGNTEDGTPANTYTPTGNGISAVVNEGNGVNYTKLVPRSDVQNALIVVAQMQSEPEQNVSQPMMSLQAPDVNNFYNTLQQFENELAKATSPQQKQEYTQQVNNFCTLMINQAQQYRSSVQAMASKGSETNGTQPTQQNNNSV